MDTLFMTADEVAKEMNVSKAYAYKVIQRMNAELAEMGYYTVSGKQKRATHKHHSSCKPSTGARVGPHRRSILQRWEKQVHDTS